MLQALLDGFLIAPPYACLALAYGLVYGMLGAMDLTVSSRFTAAAYGGWAATSALGWHPVFDPAVMSAAIAAAVGMTILTWALLEAMSREQPLTVLIGSLGLGYVLQAAYQAVFGAQPRTYESYPVESGLEFLGTSATKLQIAGLAYAVVSTCIVAQLLRSRSWGRRLRAVAADPELSTAVFAIRQRRIAWMTVLAASAVAAPAAVIHAASHGVSPETGTEMGLTAFIANVVAGRARPIGAVLVAVLLVAVRSVAITRL